jgi:hypothetical protein
MREAKPTDVIHAGECCWPPCETPNRPGRWSEGASRACDKHRYIYDHIRVFFDETSPRILELARELGMTTSRGAFNNARRHCMTAGCMARRAPDAEYCQRCLDEQVAMTELMGY